jgi:plastocyanin
MTMTSGALLAALLCALPAVANAGVIRGTLRVPARASTPALAANAYPGQAHALHGGPRITRGLVGDAVVYVDRIPARAESALAAMPEVRARLAQKDQTFVPRVIAIPVGARVDFPNQDPIYHNVFSFSPTRRFDLGKYPRGSSRSVDFPRAGLVNVYCDIHSDMEAFILVVPNRAFARPDAAGQFALPDLPPGDYRLHAWHPDFGAQELAVTLPASGDATVSLGF